MLFGRGGPIGRGFYLDIEAGGSVFHLSAQLPAAAHDLESLFALAGSLAAFLETKTVLYRGETLSPAYLRSLYQLALAENSARLRGIAESVESAAVSGVRFPVWLPVSLFERMRTVPPDPAGVYFSAYLADIQARGYAYLAPVFEANTACQTVGRYTLAAGRPTIIPAAPFVPYGPAPSGGVPQLWAVDLLAEGEHLGSVPFHALSAFLREDDCTDFDEKHRLLRGLSRRRMLQLLGKAQ